MRYIVFGCRPIDTLLVEIHTDSIREAVLLAELNTVSDYKARIWDTEKKQFIKQAVIDLAIEFFNGPQDPNPGVFQ